MALEIFKLVGSIFVDSDEAQNSIQKTDKKAQSVGQTLASGIGTAAKWGTAIVGGATAAVSAVTALATSTAEQADVIDKASQRMGIDAEEYQKLAYAAGMSGVEMSTLETASKTLQQNMPEASITDVINELTAMTDETERTAKATELLGSKAAYALAPMLNAGADGVSELMQECEDLGMVMSGDTVSAGAALGDTISAIKQSLQGMVNSLGSSVMPIVQTFADLIKDNLPQIQQLFQRISPIIMNLLEGLLPPLMNLAETLLPVIIDLIESMLPFMSELMETLLPVIVELVQTLVPPVVEIVQKLLPVLLKLIEPLLPLLEPLISLLQPILDIVVAIISPIADIIGTLLPPLIELISGGLSVALDAVGGVLKNVSSTIGKVFNVALESIRPVIEAVAGAFEGSWDSIKSVWSKVTGFFTGVWNGIKATFSGVSDFFGKAFGGVIDIVKAPVNFIIDGINTMIDAINSLSFDIPDWVPLVGGEHFGFNLDRIKKLAKGGEVGNGDLFVANENEPELIASSREGTVVVNNRQIIAAVVEGVAAAVRNVMQEMTGNSDKEEYGDIVIPIYLGDSLFDEAIVTAKDRINFRSGGRADA